MRLRAENIILLVFLSLVRKPQVKIFQRFGKEKGGHVIVAFFGDHISNGSVSHIIPAIQLQICKYFSSICLYFSFPVIS